MSPYERCPCPKTSPWGAIQGKKELAPGIWQVSTAGHGGIKLSRERNAAVPKYMRREGGWYEEDCDWALAAVVHPIGFHRVIKIEGKPDRTEFEVAMETFRNWYPSEYERFSGIMLEPGQSLKRDEQLFEIETRDKFVVTAAWGEWADWVPAGKVGVCAVNRSQSQVIKYFLVDAKRYGKRSRFGHIIDPTIDTEIKKPEKL